MKSSNSKLENGPAPEVILDVKFEDGLLFLAIRNIGPKPALNVSIRFKRRLVGINGTKVVSALSLFRNITFLAPQKEIATLLDSSASYFKRRQPRFVEAIVSFQDSAGRDFKSRICHDLSIYEEIAYLPGSGTSNAMISTPGIRDSQ